MRRFLLSALLFGSVTAFAEETVEAGNSGQSAGRETEAAVVTVESEEAMEAAESVAAGGVPEGDESDQPTFYVVPIEGQIGKPTLFILRKGVKEAVAAGADYIILDMETPGGELGVTLEMMEILDKFQGETITYINDEAISAGAFISAATDKIYFSPSGVIGAAAPVTATGEDINETMQQKIVSYLRAKIRSISEDHPYRGEVISAMVDADYELKIDDKVIKPKGELLSLTATEAMETYGDPPQPLLGAGIEDDLDSLIASLSREADPKVTRFEKTWSVNLAELLMRISPLLLGLGGLFLFIEFKTPGFGIFGIIGIAALMVVFLGHNVAGLSGHEPMLVFLLGAALVFVELLIFPGMLIFAITGILLMAGSLLWGMADIWPGEAFELSPGLFVTPAFNLAVGFLLAIVLILVVARLLPKSVFWNRLVLAAAVDGSVKTAVTTDGVQAEVSRPEVGSIGTVTRDLHPVGRVEIDGRQYEAQVDIGEIRAGTRIRVVRRGDFVLIVEPATQ